MFRSRVPVISASRLIEFAGPVRARRLAKGFNVRVVRKRKTGEIVEIHLLDHGDDSRRKQLDSDPRKLSVKCETDENPQGVWTLKRLVLVDPDSGTGSAGGGAPAPRNEYRGRSHPDCVMALPNHCANPAERPR